MAEEQTPKISASYSKEEHCAKFSITRGNDDYSGEYTKEDANIHDGEIITSQNFLTYLEAVVPSTSASVALPAAVEVVFPGNGAKASVTVKFENAFCGKRFTDAVTIICPRVEVAEVDKKAREVGREIAAVRAEIAELRAMIAEERTIAAVAARWGAIPADGREFYLTLIRRALAGDVVTLPVVGPDFIRLGAKYFACDFGGIKSHNVICCTEPQNYAGNMVTDGLRETSMLDVTSGSEVQRWIAQQARRCYFEISAGMIEHARNARIVVGRGDHTLHPMYFAISPNSANRQGESAPASYIEFTVPSADALFGVGIARTFKLFYNAKDARAAMRAPIIEEFDAACIATTSLIALAEASGMKPYVVKTRANGDCVPSHP